MEFRQFLCLINFFEFFVKTAWAALLDYDSEDYQNYFDMDSWAKMYLMYEVAKTYDAFSGSILMHRDGLTADDKLIAGPVGTLIRICRALCR